MTEVMDLRLTENQGFESRGYPAQMVGSVKSAESIRMGSKGAD